MGGKNMTRNILEYLENSAENFGDRKAFVDENGSLTFRQLMEKAKRIGSALCNTGGDMSPVPVFMEKCADEIAAFMGVVYAGRAYAPIDPQMPEKRVSKILETLEAKTVIADAECIGKLEALDYKVENALLIDDLDKRGIDEEALSRVRRMSPTGRFMLTSMPTTLC